MTFMKISKLLAALVLTALGSVAQATTYNYSYTFTRWDNDTPVVVHGSFDGTASGSNLVINLSNITASIDGLDFNGSGNLFSGHIDSGDWQAGGAVASVDGKNNNFVFADRPASNLTGYTNLLWAVPVTSFEYPDVKIHRTTPLVYRQSYSNPGKAVWTLTAAVPEPETYAMLLAGLGVMGALARRRQSKQA